MTEAPFGTDLETALGLLHQGRWALSMVASAFRARLLMKLGLPKNSELPLFSLTTRTYRPDLRIPESINGLGPLKPVTALSSDQAAFWKAAVASLGIPNAEFIEATVAQKAEIQNSLCLLQEHQAAALVELQQWVSHLCFFRSETFRSASHPHFFGCIFLNPDHSAHDMAISLIHELGHQELFALNLLDRLVQASADYNLVHAPYQGRRRPPIGMLHSAHALYRMIPLERATNSPRLERHRNLLRETVVGFRDEDLTAFARSLIETIYAPMVA